jgi:hypothetical protein
MEQIQFTESQIQVVRDLEHAAEERGIWKGIGLTIILFLAILIAFWLVAHLAQYINSEQPFIQLR